MTNDKHDENRRLLPTSARVSHDTRFYLSILLSQSFSTKTFNRLTKTLSPAELGLLHTTTSFSYAKFAGKLLQWW